MRILFINDGGHLLQYSFQVYLIFGQYCFLTSKTKHANFLSVDTYVFF